MGYCRRVRCTVERCRVQYEGVSTEGGWGTVGGYGVRQGSVRY